MNIEEFKIGDCVEFIGNVDAASVVGKNYSRQKPLTTKRLYKIKGVELNPFDTHLLLDGVDDIYDSRLFVAAVDL